MEKLKKLSSGSMFFPLFALFVLLIFNAIFTPDFFKLQIIDGELYGRLIDILSRASSLIIITIAMTFVIATGGIDISVGSIIAISGAVTCTLIGGAVDGTSKTPFALAIIIAILAGAISGVWNGFLVAKLKIQPIVATLILLTAGRGVAMLLTQGQIITVYYEPFAYIGGAIPGSLLPTTMFIAAAVVLIVWVIMKRTSAGLFIQSVGINHKASYYAGINVNQITFLVYVFSGICGGISGLIESSMIQAADAHNAGLNMELDAITAVALGGTLLSGGKFNLGGSIIGAITIQTLTTTMYAVGVSSEKLPVVKAVVIILICLIQSDRFKTILVNRKVKIRSNQKFENNSKEIELS